MDGLHVDSGLGVPDSLKNAFMQAEKDIKASRHDYTNYGAEADTIASLLSPTLVRLHGAMRADDCDGVDINYTVESADGPVTSPCVRSTRVDYQAPASGRVSAVMMCGRELHLMKVSKQEAMNSLVAYAQRVNVQVPVGDANEMMQLIAVNRGPDLRLLFVRMWLLHLDVVAGAEVTVDLDATHVRGSMPVGLGPELQSEYAKSLSGVRMHIASLDDVDKALVVGSCDSRRVTNASTRATRYTWARIPLSLYGGTLTRPGRKVLNEPIATARAIVGFADKYGCRRECGLALETALWMYGTQACATQLELGLCTPYVHQDIHGVSTNVAGPWSCRELASRELVSLAKFVGLSVNQVGGQVLRRIVNKLHMRDVDGAEAFITNTHTRLLLSAGRLMQAQLRPILSGYFDWGALLWRNVSSFWGTRGFAHSMMFGCIVSGSVAAEAAGVLDVPTHRDVGVGDDPRQGGAAKRAAGRLWFINELMRNAGANIRQTTMALTEDMPDDATVSADTLLHAGGRVRFTIIGPRGSLQLQKLSQRGFSFEPRDAVIVRPGVDTGADAVMAIARTKPEEGDEHDLTATLNALRGPPTSTRVRATRALAATVGPNTTGPILLVANDINASSALGVLKRAAWGRTGDARDGLSGAAAAIQDSLTQQVSMLGVGPPPESDELEQDLKPLLDEDGDIVDDVMEEYIRKLGYRPGLVTEKDGPGFCRGSVGPGTGAVLWLHYDDKGSWAPIGPGGRPYRI